MQVFKCDFDEKANYAHTFEEKSVLLWYNKNLTNDEIIERKEIDIYQRLSFSFYSSGENSIR